MPDRNTIAAYTDWAEDYRGRFDRRTPDAQLTAFIAGLPDGGRVLDLGCGVGRSSILMIEAGFEVDALDATPAFIAMARQQFGVEVRLGTFDEIDAEADYDGIFANFSLLHAPKTELPAHLARIARALRPGGLFHIGLKTGEGEARDSLGRFYAYYSDSEITEHLEAAGFRVMDRWFGSGEGLDGTLADWIVLHARKVT